MGLSCWNVDQQSTMTTAAVLLQSYQTKQHLHLHHHQQLSPVLTTNVNQCWANRVQLVPFTLLVLQLLAVAAVSGFEPDFLFPLENVTVAQGRDATFTCVVNNLGGYRVAWIKADTKAILAIHEHVITNNARLTVTHNDYNTWTLNIRGVRSEDRGQYMCQVNTDPMKMQTAFLEVVIPPDIIYEETSGDMMVPEGGSAKLVCKARGHPKPRIMWKREDGADIVSRETHGMSGAGSSASMGGSTSMNRNRSERFASIESEMLNLHKVTRSEMGAYLCIAANGVPPSVSKRLMLHVHFHPLIQVPNQLVGAPINTDVTLQCHVEASPKAINYWTRESGEMIISTGNDKYFTNETNSSYYSVHMWLIIRRFQKSDFGGYKCISKNSIGDAEGTIRLYEMEQERIESSLGVADDFSDSDEENSNDAVDSDENNSLHRNSLQGPLTESADSGTRPASSEASVGVAITLASSPFVLLLIAALLVSSYHFLADV